MLNSCVRDALVASVSVLAHPPSAARSENCRPCRSAASASARAQSQPGHVVEQPRDLRARKVRIDHETGRRRDMFRPCRRRESDRNAAPCAGPARRLRCTPEAPVSTSQIDGRFALIGDADAGQRRAPSTPASASAPRAATSVVSPQQLRVVLHPAVVREYLIEFALGAAEHATVRIESRARASWTCPDRLPVRSPLACPPPETPNTISSGRERGNGHAKNSSERALNDPQDHPPRRHSLSTALPLQSTGAPHYLVFPAPPTQDVVSDLRIVARDRQIAPNSGANEPGNTVSKSR